MTRLEENRMIIDEMAKRTELKPTGTYEEMVTFQLGAIATMLADISKSLAILANKGEREGKEAMINWSIVISVAMGIALADLYKAVSAVIFAWLKK